MGPIWVFDSGYGGLTVLKEIRRRLPQYDYLYLWDNARAPYGSRSFETIFQYTWENVEKLFHKGCSLVILACNTASARALREIQQKKLPLEYPDRRVLGVIRPTVEKIGLITKSRHIGILATEWTVKSRAYDIEISHFYPDIVVNAVACPLWVPLIENNEYATPGARYFIEKYVGKLLEKDGEIDTIILGCTHYPLIQDQIQEVVWEKIQVISQGEIVAESLEDYLFRHGEMDLQCSKKSWIQYFTTDSEEKFVSSASLFLGEEIDAEKME